VEREIGRGQTPDAATRARTADILRNMPSDGRPHPRPSPLDPGVRP
jgi:hypothetical protein